MRAGWLEVHLSHLDKIGGESYSDLVDSSRDMGRKFQWDAILPAESFEGKIDEKYHPRDATEQRWLAEWSAAPAAPPPAATDVATQASTANQFLSSRGKYHQRYIEEPDGRRSYQYYQPMYADPSCVNCHKHLVEVGRRPNLVSGDLMAMIRVTTDYDAIADQIAHNKAYLWIAAIVVGFVSMISLWAVVRYVIVKPVTHLRDVANAVREGDIEKRAVIRTGDEFEELGSAFNRMLRQLLSQQSELKLSKNRAG